MHARLDAMVDMPHRITFINSQRILVCDGKKGVDGDRICQMVFRIK